MTPHHQIMERQMIALARANKPAAKPIVQTLAGMLTRPQSARRQQSFAPTSGDQ